MTHSSREEVKRGQVTTVGFTAEDVSSCLGSGVRSESSRELLHPSAMSPGATSCVGEAQVRDVISAVLLFVPRALVVSLWAA